MIPATTLHSIAQSSTPGFSHPSPHLHALHSDVDLDPDLRVKPVGGMVSLFEPAEAAYDRYAAAIAATEPLRVARDEKVRALCTCR